MGKILDKEYARFKKKVVGRGNSDTEREGSDFVNDGAFPLEVVRAICSQFAFFPRMNSLLDRLVSDLCRLLP